MQKNNIFDKKFLNIALKEALKAFNKNEVPVGAVIVKDNKVIAKAYNKKEERKNVLAHAEILAILKASKKLNNWRLSGCVMYTTLEPCYMCMEAIKQSRIEQVFFILNSLTTEDKNIDKIKISDVYLENQVKLMVKKFFEKYRK